MSFGNRRMAVESVSPQQLREMLAGKNPPLLLDVRDQWEYDVAHLEGARLLPLDDLQVLAFDLPRDREIVVYCHHGMRSAAAVNFLMQNQFTNVKNLSGGIDRWACELDPEMPRY
jgi:rhodanese-related sulfurtransferase